MAAYALTLSLTAGAAVLALAAQSPQTAMPEAVRVIDGEPTAEACARYGYAAVREDYDAVASAAPMVTGRRMAQPNLAKPSPSKSRRDKRMAPPPPAPPPPPPPPPGLYAAPGFASAGQPMMPGPPPGWMETERYPDAPINPVRRVAEQPVSTFSIDVDTASYANVRRFLNDGRPAAARRRAGRGAGQLLRLRLPAARRRPRRRSSPSSRWRPRPGRRARRSSTSACRATTWTAAEQPPLNLVFLVDVSGSMSSEDRLPLAEKSLNVLIDQLRPQDRVSMVVYAGSAGAVLAPTPGYEKLKMRCALQALHAGGSTAGGQGLALAYDLAQQQLRQGRGQPGDPDDRRRLQRRRRRSREAGGLRRREAQDRRLPVGLRLRARQLQRRDDADPGPDRERHGGLCRRAWTRRGSCSATTSPRSLFPIADDVKIQVEFNPARVSEYRLIGYETRLLNREDFNNDRVDAGEVGAGASVTALYEITPVGRAGRRSIRCATSPSGRPRRAATASSPSCASATSCRARPTSQLIERPIGDGDRAVSLAAAPEVDPLRARGGGLRPAAAGRSLDPGRLRLARHRAHRRQRPGLRPRRTAGAVRAS